MSRKGVIYLLVLTLLSSCNFERDVFVAESDISNWWRAATIPIESRDTTEIRDISILLRYHSDILTADSLQINIITTTPSERRIAERLTLPLRSRDSLSKRGVELIEVPYRVDVRWRELGDYSMSIYPTQPIDGVEATGVVITKK